MRECVDLIPDRQFIYFADNYNVPYGNLTHDGLLKAVDTIFEKIAKHNPSAAVIACNTVTAQCAAILREKYDFPIIGIQPAVKPAAAVARKCLVLATPLTASSASVAELVTRFGNGITQVIACPELASYIEQNIFDLDEGIILKMLPDVEADAVVLGCTHYSYIYKYVQKRYGCKIYDGLEGTARHLGSVLGISEKKHNKAGDFDRVTFIGGDEKKNRAVFSYLIFQYI